MLTAILLTSLTWQAVAQQEKTGQHEKTECLASYCLESGEIKLAVALGYGERVNPLNFSDNRSLIMIPDLAWYGENWYLDNAEVGYQWIQKPSFAIETFATLNLTNRDFQGDHGSNFLLDGSEVLGSVEEGLAPGTAPDETPGDSQGADSGAPSSDPTNDPIIDDGFPTASDLAISPDDVSDRDFAVDFGIRAHWYQDKSEWSLALYHDVSNTYKGARAKGQYKKVWHLGQWRLVSSASLQWKSADLLDYYYGVDREDTDNPFVHYEADSGWFTQVALSANRKISENWHWLLHVSYTHLPDAMTDSPLVEKDYTLTTFAGVTYRF